MKKFLLLLLVACIGFTATSCSLFGDKDKDEDDTLNPTFTLTTTEILAGKEFIVSGYIDQKYTDAGFEFRLGETVVPHKVMGSAETALEISGNLSGRHNLYFVSAGRTVLISEVSVFKLASSIMPGKAFRVDLSDSKTIFCTEKKNETHQPMEPFIYTTQKFDEGKQPVDAKFYNSKGGEVPACFISITDLSPDFFYAQMINAHSKESLQFNYEDFTCNVILGSGWGQPVIIEKKSGIITGLSKSEGDTFAFGSDMSFQQIAPRMFCFTNSTYSSEFTFNKLYSFEIDEYPSDVLNTVTNKEIPDFQFDAPIKMMPQQDNLDIINSREAHWLALGTGTVLYNKDRMLWSGSLSSVNIPKDRYTQLFGCRIAANFYYFDYTYDGGNIFSYRTINTANGGRLHTEPNCNCQYDVYQCSDSTYIRARAEKAGDKIHSYSIKPDATDRYKLHRYETTVTAPEQYGNIIDYAFPRYPCSSNYEYYASESGEEVFRRRISAYNAEKSLCKASNGAFIRLASASQNAISLVFYDILSFPEKNLITEINANGNVVQTIETAPGARVLGICRLKD